MLTNWRPKLIGNILEVIINCRLKIIQMVQESLEFSPAKLVFGHTVRGPLKVLKEQIFAQGKNPKSNVLDYVSRFKERLHDVCKMSLPAAQKGMKCQYDERAVSLSFTHGEKVLVLLLVLGSTLSARFYGPYVVTLSDTDYVVN